MADLKLLLVDDEVEFLEPMKARIERRGITCATAESGAEALAILGRFPGRLRRGRREDARDGRPRAAEAAPPPLPRRRRHPPHGPRLGRAGRQGNGAGRLRIPPQARSSSTSSSTRCDGLRREEPDERDGVLTTDKGLGRLLGACARRSDRRGADGGGTERLPRSGRARFRMMYDRFREILALNDATLELVAEIGIGSAVVGRSRWTSSKGASERRPWTSSSWSRISTSSPAAATAACTTRCGGSTESWNRSSEA